MLYKWYILPIGGLYATYHLLGEPKTTIELVVDSKLFLFLCFTHGVVLLPVHISYSGGARLTSHDPINGFCIHPQSLNMELQNDAFTHGILLFPVADFQVNNVNLPGCNPNF